jgi:hypothetical protein
MYIGNLLPAGSLTQSRWPLASAYFGEPVAAPRGLVLLEHTHIPRTPSTTTPGQFDDGAAARLAPGAMNPGFINAGDALITDTSATGLQTCLQRLITTQFANFLAAPATGAPAANDRLRVGLIDLSGARLTNPDFAGWGSTVAMYGASVPKILGLYAAHQLRNDLRALATARSLTNGAALERAAVAGWRASGLRGGFPDLVWLFDIRRWTSAAPLAFTTRARNACRDIMHNCPAGELIVRVGFPYIASVTFQSGLRHPTRGGLWLTSSYCNKGGWSGNPLPTRFGHNATALSAATFFTLLAQGRLVDAATSAEMRGWLRGNWAIGAPGGCFMAPFFNTPARAASKCGLLNDGHRHDCVLVVRGTVRYAVAGLTRLRGGEVPRYNQLFERLDDLIVRNNLSPKAAC